MKWKRQFMNKGVNFVALEQDPSDLEKVGKGLELA